MTKIYFGEANYLVQAELAPYDVGNLAEDGSEDEAGAGDHVLNDSEIALAEGFDELAQGLRAGGYGLVARNLEEFDVLPIATEESEPKPQTEMAEPSTGRTPNGKDYPGVIISVPGGEFEMGTVCDGRHGYDGTHNADEHTSDGRTVRVKISDFRMAKTEVTIGQYVHYLMESRGISESEARKMLPDDGEGNNKKGDNFPVVALSFKEKMGFAKYYGGTLPTAAQIEYASKGPSHNDVYGTPIGKAITASNGATTIAEACGPNDERANGWGFCDLGGNAWETTSTKYESGSYDNASLVASNPYKDSGLLEYRGGSFFSYARFARAAFRCGDDPDSRRGNDGFRASWPAVSKSKISSPAWGGAIRCGFFLCRKESSY